MLALKINGRNVNAEVEPRTHLADFVREAQNLTGTHLGCEHGVCGACTILVDGVPVRSCITYAVSCAGASVTTIEGLDDDEIAKELRAAFSREHALQCGYCTPGMLISARDLVLRVQSPSEHEVRIAMSGNLCRCTGYVGIIDAIRSVIADRRARGITAIPGAGRTALGPAGSDHNHRCRRAGCRRSAGPRRGCSQGGARTRSAAGEKVLANFTPQASFDQSFVVRSPARRRVALLCGRAGGRRLPSGSVHNRRCQRATPLPARCASRLARSPLNFTVWRKSIAIRKLVPGRYEAAVRTGEAARRRRVSSAIDCYRSISSRRGLNSMSAID